MFGKTLIGLVLGGVLAMASCVFGAKIGLDAHIQARIALDRTIPAVNFTNVTLRDAIDFLRDVTGINVQVHWKAMEQAGVTPDMPVNIRLRQVTLRKVLGLVLTEVAGGPRLAFYVDDGVIEVTTKEIADNQMFTKVYPVQEFLIDPPEFFVPDFTLGGEGSNNSGGRSGRGSSGYDSGSRNSTSRNTSASTNRNTPSSSNGNLFPPMPTGQDKEKDAKAKELVAMIQEIVQPDVWKDTGSGRASIRFFNGSLIVTAPRSVHEEIGGPID